MAGACTIRRRIAFLVEYRLKSEGLFFAQARKEIEVIPLALVGSISFEIRKEFSIGKKGAVKSSLIFM